MFTHRIRLYCLTSLSLFIFSSQSYADIKTFEAADFPVAWTTDNMQSGGTYSVTAVATGGNPGSFLNINLIVNGGFQAVTTFSYLPIFIHNPSTQGVINSIDYAFDTKRGASPAIGNAQAYGIGLKQNGIHYYTYYADSITTWQPIAETGILASDFFVDGGDYESALVLGLETPDFSSSGSEITFGYWRGNSTTYSNSYAEGYMDNYNVSIDFTPVPEPSQAALALGLSSLCCLVLRRRTR